MKLNQYSAEQKLTLVEDLREIRNVVGRIAAAYLLYDHDKLLDSFWSRREDICLTVNEGYYAGRAAVDGYYKSVTARTAAVGKLIQARLPEQLGDKSDAELFGRGELDYKSTDTYVIEVAQDRETAKGIWCVRGSESRLTAGGPQAFWEWGWFAIDFVLEDGQWRVWHMQHLQEVKRPSGYSWSGEPVAYETLPEFAAVDSLRLAEPNYPATVRERYHAARPFTPSPRVPEPYVHFADTFSYGMPV